MTVLTQLQTNPILRTDSYKASHWLQYPEGVDAAFAYVESRGCALPTPLPYTLFFGLQAYLREYLSKPFTAEHIQAADAFWQAHGEPFNKVGWTRLLNKHGGYFPVSIRALPEGTVAPLSVPLLTIESTDAGFAWVPAYLETELLRAVWYPTTVATISRAAKEIIRAALDKTSDDTAGQLSFKLHDFGARGVSSLESAALGGMAHLVNFMGSDTVSGVLAANAYYDSAMSGFSIPAAEHSTITSWGRDAEAQAYANMLKQFAKPGSLLAVVSDSYDIYNACDVIWGGELKQQVIDSGATLVIRPDSGNPPEVVAKCMEILATRFGTTLNSKGFKVLKHVRIIQGDGINLDSLPLILDAVTSRGFAADNVGFGMGGGLLQQLNRDTFKFAMKTSAVRVNGEWRNVFKQPVTDAGKGSKRGLLDTHATAAGLRAGLVGGGESALREVFRNGKVLVSDSLDAIRARAEATIGAFR
jgi:nicotinamide phosphoribosyltransferase